MCTSNNNKLYLINTLKKKTFITKHRDTAVTSVFQMASELSIQSTSLSEKRPETNLQPWGRRSNALPLHLPSNSEVPIIKNDACTN